VITIRFQSLSHWQLVLEGAVSDTEELIGRLVYLELENEVNTNLQQLICVCSLCLEKEI